MPEFRYKAVDATGAARHGVMEAASADIVILNLQRSGLIPLTARPVGRRSIGSDILAAFRPSTRLSSKDIAAVTTELATLLGAGQDMNSALLFICQTAPQPRLRQVMEAVREKVRGGTTLAEALAAPPANFPRLYVGLVRAGESSGTLAATLERLAELLDREQALTKTVTSALIYPALLLCSSIAIVCFLIGYVLPQFVPLFEQNGAELPWQTSALIALGSGAASFGPFLLLLGLGAVMAARRALQDPAIRKPADQFMLRVPVVGSLIREILAARFCRTLGTLLANGIPLIVTLGIVKDTLGNLAAVEAVETAALSARGGKGLAASLAAAGIFPVRTTHLLRLGEETAQMAPIALKLAAAHEEGTRITIERIVALLVPIMTIVLGAVVAAIIGSLLMAMLSLNDLAR